MRLSTNPEVADEDERLFREVLSREILESEKRRTAIMATVFAFAYFFASAATLILDSESRYSGGVLILISALLAGYEWALHSIIVRRLAQNAGMQGWTWYVNALIEISVLTAGLYVAGLAYDAPMYSLTMPAVMVYFAFILLATLRLDFRIGVFTGFLAAVEYLALAWYTLSHLEWDEVGLEVYEVPFFHVQRATLFMVGGLVAAFIARHIGQRTVALFRALGQRDRILKLFGQHVSPAVAELLLREGADVTSRRVEVTILFLDIRRFSSYAETHSPEETMAYLNRLFDVTIPVVGSHRGMVHQLLGDGFLAYFGTPLAAGNHSRDAVDAALEMLERVRNAVENGHLPPTDLGIGIHTGEALTGIVGSAAHREYKITGDVVNVAARIEQLNKQFGSQLLVSDSVREHLDVPEHSLLQRGAVEVRGRNHPVVVYQLA